METSQMGCGELFKRIKDIFEIKVNKDLQAHDVTLSQMKTLICLDRMADKSATLKELERFFGTSQATVAGIAVRLEQKGLVEGYADAKDRRVKHIRLSEQGKALCRQAQSGMEAGEAWLLETLNEEEKRTLQRLLQKVYDHIR